jgi:hypothetical protein
MRLEWSFAKMRRLSAALGMVVLGCGGGDGDDSTGTGPLGRCGIRAETAGGALIRFTGDNDAACGTQHSFDTGLDVIFIGTSAQGSLEIAVEDVAEGETGEDYPTRVMVTNPAKQRWQSPGCVTSISEHGLVEVEDSEIGELRHYQVSGSGSCAEELESVPAGDAGVSLDAFAFRAEFTWRD